MGYRHFEYPTEDVGEVARRIKKLRERDNERQEDLAKAIGCSKATIANIEQGKSDPSLKTVMNIAQHYKVSVDYICGRSIDMTISSSVLDCLCRHISLKIKSYTMLQSHDIPVISIHKGFFEYLKQLARAEQFRKTVPDEVIRPCLKNKSCTKWRVYVNYPYGNKTI